MSTKTTDSEKEISHPLEEIFDIEENTTIVPYKEVSTELVPHTTFDPKDSEIEELNKTISKKDKFIEEQTAHLEKLKAKLFVLEPPEMLTDDITTEGRIKCVRCGAVGKDIKGVEDKSKILSYMGNIPMYARKHVCKKCGYEF